MRIKHSIEIAAPVARVWKLTLDVEKWPDLTPTITRIEWLSEPPVRVGCQARIKQPGQRAKIWTVTEFEPERCFTWATRSLGLTMTGSHRLAASDAGTTNLLSIDLEGPLAPLVGALFRRPILKAIATENEGFKAAAELG
ncbi:MAG: SRPBCC family protein [Planctomycetota bacterium]|jgi:carbon monoxide dehydrogenase subunit G